MKIFFFNTKAKFILNAVEGTIDSNTLMMLGLAWIPKFNLHIDSNS